MADVRSFKTIRSQLPPEWQQYITMIPMAIVAVLVVATLFTSFFTVASDEEGIVQLFGRYVRTVESGLHWKLPFGIERATKVRVEYIHKEEFGPSTLNTSRRRRSSAAQIQMQNPQMLTGDLNIADVDWIVQYRIRDPKIYLFKVKNVEQTLRNVSESVMRRVVGDRSVTEVLTFGRVEIASLVETEMQELLDQYETGLVITTVQLKDVNPPGPVRPSFNEVNEARQEKERIKNQAWAAYNKAIPEAEGAALRAVSEAEGYGIDRVNRAKGDADRFTAVLREYRRAPAVTRTRLYLEAMAEVLPRIEHKYIIDDQMRGILPLLDLGGQPALKKKRAGGEQ